MGGYAARARRYEAAALAAFGEDTLAAAERRALSKRVRRWATTPAPLPITPIVRS